MEILQVNQLHLGITKKNDKTTLVNSISFHLTEGMTTALVGESGSGKSLTALSILKLLPEKIEQNGTILFNKNGSSIELNALTEKRLQHIRGKEIGMVFQEPMSALNPLIHCGEQITETIRRHLKLNQSAARNKTLDLLAKVELDEPEKMYDRYPHQLSGGQQQRIMIAMAICCEPSILIADEPTTALDVQVQEQILKLIRKLQRETKMSVLLITHDIGLVEHYADEVLVMYKGEMVEEGTKDQILYNCSHPYTKGLLACRPTFSSKGKRLPILEDFYTDGNTTTEVERPNEDILFASSTIMEERRILDVDNLQVGYYQNSKSLFQKQQWIKILSEINFDVKKGEIMGLVGESGSGKSTLGKAILGMLPIMKGHVKLDGIDVSKFTRKEFARKIQLVFQDPYGSLNPNMTVGEALIEPMRIHEMHTNNSMRKDKCIELLEMVGLGAGDFFKYPHQFSGGQRQRICISRALSLDPDFLVFDESVSALDLSIQSQILNLIMELRSKLGFSGLFISHNLNVIHYISDRILVIQKGEIVEQGVTEEVLSNPVDEYTKRLVSASLGSFA